MAAPSARVARLLLSAVLLVPPAACVTARPVASLDERIAALEARLAMADSATAVLEGICADRSHSEPLTLRAEKLSTPPIAPTPRNRLVLDVSPQEPVTHRHVRLSCGGVVLSEAH
ncbi:MAG: hypothetical protein N2423_05820, partial [Novosphingobium sp.]|nr:hypothetical protein [Novosphingobium sp.]